MIKPPAVPQKKMTIAIIGNPNTGKSTLFNLLSGGYAHIGNFPGVTVEKKVGSVIWEDRQIDLVDLPGTYSLAPRSIDEMLAVDVLLGRQKSVPLPDAIICIADASNLERNFYLFSQILDLSIPVILVLNMCDLARSRGIEIDSQALSKKLNLPVVCTEAHQGKGIDELKSAILKMGVGAEHQPLALFPDVFYQERNLLKEKLQDDAQQGAPNFLVDRLLLDVGGYVESYFEHHTHDGLIDELNQARTRLKAAGCAVPAMEARLRYGWAGELLQGVVHQPADEQVTISDKIDQWMTHRVFGFLFFFLLMFFVFQSVFTWAGPTMDLIESGQEFVDGSVESLIPPGPLRSLVVDGVIAGVGGVLIFLPQIVILYFFIAVLEDSGYMARAAFIMDRLMRSLGLSGKSFIPLMSSFACAVPGIMATRVIENRHERLTTILVAPLMSCSARWPVYTLFIAAFIPNIAYLSIANSPIVTLQGIVLFGMSSIGALVAIPVAWILKRFFFQGDVAPFVMELPDYKWPSPRNVILRVYRRAKSFVVKAGTLIFTTSIIIWAAGYFPGDHSEQFQIQSRIESNEASLGQIEDQLASVTEGDQESLKELQNQQTLLTSEQADLYEKQNQVSSQLVETSFLGMSGHWIEPVVKPLGWDWKIGVGVIASFPAREVIISTLGTIYSLGGDAEDESGLIGSIRAATWPDGRKVFNIPVAISIMVFFALCAQCAATLMVIQRETNSWFWPVVSFTYMTALAYVGAFISYQVGMFFV
ncbi:MAG: ferrous iron transport protein B [Planctomycetes bacterium]|nr:ferrous iron transport protein B [Planctomycetota bacterium]MCH9727851.1 ferrous iron transport protein B [Planctomycetota bacterium]MCH9775481.1 ferrous iron transport protein B [Planctomycetota bacterium]MCH9790525.1 ferrous iron transport protein B [Planctomycetota bacterium]